MTEIDENTKEVSDDLVEEVSIKEALEHLHISAFTKEELTYYDKYWDKISTERTAIYDKEMEKLEAIKERNKAIKNYQKAEQEKLE